MITGRPPDGAPRRLATVVRGFLAHVLIIENRLFSVRDWLKAFPRTWRWLPNLLAARTVPFSPGRAVRGGMGAAAADSL
jgi:hypothetical protein